MQKDATIVRESMRANYCSFTTSDNIFDAVARMQKFNISGGPVLNDKHEPIGFLSEQDCIQPLLKASYHCEMTATVGDVMRTEVLTVDADMSIVDLATQFTVTKPKLYPVTSAGKVVGIISRKEVINTLLESGRDCHLVRSAS